MSNILTSSGLSKLNRLRNLVTIRKLMINRDIGGRFGEKYVGAVACSLVTSSSNAGNIANEFEGFFRSNVSHVNEFETPSVLISELKRFSDLFVRDMQRCKLKVLSYNSKSFVKINSAT